MPSRGLRRRGAGRLVPAAPRSTSAAASAAMRGNKRAGTRPEMTVRRLLHNMGYRFRLHAADLPGKPDIVFRSRRVAIRVQGCFWHQHADSDCPLVSQPRSNSSYWVAKLARNVARDKEQELALKQMGWRVETVWECECQRPKALSAKLVRSLELDDLNQQGQIRPLKAAMRTNSPGDYDLAADSPERSARLGRTPAWRSL